MRTAAAKATERMAQLTDVALAQLSPGPALVPASEELATGRVLLKGGTLHPPGLRLQSRRIDTWGLVGKFDGQVVRLAHCPVLSVRGGAMSTEAAA